MDIKKECIDIIKTNKNNMKFFTYQQGKIFRKFKSLVEQFKITKGTTIFKMNIAKLVDKYPKMMNFSNIELFKNWLAGYQGHLQEKPGRF